MNPKEQKKPSFSAVVLAAGAGKRMGTLVAKQYLSLGGRPLMVHSLETFEKSGVDEIILVVSSGETGYVQQEIVARYGLSKVAAVVEGGRERYDSVYQGLQAASGDYVLIHDCARAFLTRELVERCMTEVVAYRACVVGVPSKDTVKLVTKEGFVHQTPSRNLVWNVQTPQCFFRPLILDAYRRGLAAGIPDLTDDAMVVEHMTDIPVKMVQGSYDNIKITTPEDLALGEEILRKRAENHESMQAEKTKKTEKKVIDSPE